MDTLMLVQGQTLLAALVAWLIQRVKVSDRFPAFSEQSSKLAKVGVSAPRSRWCSRSLMCRPMACSGR